jgi:hypothetical protein
MARKLDNKSGSSLSIVARSTIAITGGGGRFVMLDTDPFNIVLCTAGALMAGVIPGNLNALESVDVVKDGIRLLKVTAAGTPPAIGDEVSSDALGCAQKAAPGDFVGGRCTAPSPTAAAGELASVELSSPPYEAGGTTGTGGMVLAASGQATLTAGGVTVSTTKVKAGSLINLTVGTVGGTPGTYLAVGTISAGTSFTIATGGGSDTSVINWFIYNPA